MRLTHNRELAAEVFTVRLPVDGAEVFAENMIPQYNWWRGVKGAEVVKANKFFVSLSSCNVPSPGHLEKAV